MLWYGSVLLVGILRSIVSRRRLMKARFVSRRTNASVRGSRRLVVQVGQRQRS